MAHRIEVSFKEGFRDALGERTKKGIVEDLGINVQSVRTVDIYTLDADLARSELENLGKELFVDSVVQDFTVDSNIASNFSWLIEVGLKPGVTDNVGRTSKEATEDVLKRSIRGAYYSTQYLIRGNITKSEAEKIASGFLANGLIQRWEIKSSDDIKKDPIRAFLPVVKLDHEPEVKVIDLNVDDSELMAISRDRVLALTLEEMKVIRSYYSRPGTKKQREHLGLVDNATDVEMEALAQTWSEHCKHKIFNAKIDYKDGPRSEKIDSLFKTYIKGATKKINRPWLLSVFEDNAGIISFDKDWSIAVKVETHNSPSALDPYGGALTGIVGVNRDCIGAGMGSKLIFNTNVFCFAPPSYNKKIPERLLHPRRVFEGVRRGVEHGGNKSGIPTVNGSIVFDERFLGKPLVYCGTCGIMPSRIMGEPSHVKKAATDDFIVMVGGRIGKDGIHGATFSSEALHEKSPVTAVQIGDPITQKKMHDFLLEARDQGLYSSITDNGAGGLSSSIGEMARASGGCEIYLEKCPLKYAGLDPWEILVSESQERMTLAVKEKIVGRLLDLAKRRDVEATIIGKFTGSGKFHVLHKNKTVAYLDMDFLHDGLPQMELSAEWEDCKNTEPDLEELKDYNKVLEKMLGRLNICSKEYVVRQYDHEVQGGSAVKPLVGKDNDGPSDAAVVRPILDSREGIVVSHGICPKYSDIDTYHMAACAIDEALRNALCVGVSLDHTAGLDNFCWCDPVESEKTPDGKYKLAQLVRANKALYDYSIAFGVPCISGKDSMKNDYHVGSTKISIPPTLLFSLVGKINDVEKAVTMDAKEEGDLVYVCGLTKDELGGSEYYNMLGFVGRNVPSVDKDAIKMYRALETCIKKGLLRSCHDCSDGGLAVALAESAFSGNLGMKIDLSRVPSSVKRDDKILFSESQSRFVITVSTKHSKDFENTMRDFPVAYVGEVAGNKFLVKGLDGSTIINSNIADLKNAWKGGLGFS